MESLLEKGADPNFTDSGGNTPLSLAVDKRLLEVGELLLLYGAKLLGISVTENETGGASAYLPSKKEICPWKESIHSRLYDKIKTDDATAKNAFDFYFSLAHKGGSQAQFELASMFFLDDRFLDKEQAKLWLERAAKLGHEQAKNALQNIKDYENMPPPPPRPKVAPPISYSAHPGYDQKFEEDFRELFTPRLKENEDFGGELWSAMANVSWIHKDDPDRTECRRSFRCAGSMIASMLGIGDYIDWYCSGPYETVSEYIAEKMSSKGWRYEVDGDGSPI
jgi:hypothetical protein